ncbi:MAG: D-glycero-beta-D-manno-heptose-7-phosphate kinase [Verrucomicrobia bacterium]|jgi:D-beta-D-heptose 7-phosphate kinase/D-beta-D-heptose 1-phosphate adenosyltransferase|nr:D-glycero-beta-D-manno-heptose-7-phosphate kinase [Verrucomicrobiota bacterium]
MKPPTISRDRVRALLQSARRCRILVVGDVMLDQFVWGEVSRISPEAPVPVLDFKRESFMPGGAANVARNLSSLGLSARLFSVVGRDPAARELIHLLRGQKVVCAGLFAVPGRLTSTKTRVVAHQQQVVRIDRESRDGIDSTTSRRLLQRVRQELASADGVIVGDYGKGVVTQGLLDGLRGLCRKRGVWLSMDPKPVHSLDLKGLSLITPNRKETFELAGLLDNTRQTNPLKDRNLMLAVNRLLDRLQPALLLVTLGEQGMLLCRRHASPLHIPTIAQEVFDVSGAGDTVISAFTAAITVGASPVEAALISNHAAGIVVGKIGTATVTPEELARSFA